MRKQEAEILYIWFKLYQKEIPIYGRWDFLNFIRKSIKLDPKHEEFYLSYGIKNNLCISS